MPSKRTKFQVVDKEGKVLETGSVSTKSTATTPEGIPIEPEFEKPLVTVSVSNPFRKILYWLDQIRKKQTTTLAFKLSIPLIALPVLVFAVFQIGRGAGISFAKSQVSPKPSVSASAPPSPYVNVEISRAGTLRIAKGSTQTRYLLGLRNGEIVNLDIPNSIDLTKYAEKQVLVTGIQDKTTGVIKVSDIAEIEVFNATKINSSPQSSPAPESTSSANQN